jgi:hypothetical protein
MLVSTPVFRSDNAIKFPITQARSCINNRGPLRDINTPRDQAPTRRRSPALITLFATLPQIQIERPARSFVQPDMPIEAFVTDFRSVFVVEGAADLFRAPLPVAQKRLHTGNQARCHHSRHTIPCQSSLHRKAVRLQKTIAAETLVPTQFTADRALADANVDSYYLLRQTSSLKGINLASLVSGQMVVAFWHFGSPS